MRSPRIVVSLLLLIPAAVLAQDQRAELAGAVDDYASAADVPLETLVTRLRQGVDPSLGPPDQTWSLAIQYLVVELLFNDQRDDAAAWAHFGMRLANDMRYDPNFVDDDVAALLDSARTAARSQRDDTIVATRYDWADATAQVGTGRVIVEGVPSLFVSVPGRATAVGGGPAIALPAGVYDFAATAAGHEDRSIRRAVLPGVTTRLRFNLPPIVLALPPDSFPPDVRDASLARLAELHVARYGFTTDSCATGFFIAGDLVTTTYGAIRGSDSITVRLASGRTVLLPVQVAVYDAGENIAVLRVPGAAADSFTVAETDSLPEFQWSVGSAGCRPPDARRVQLAEWNAASPNPLFPGAPLVDQDGRVLGIAVTADSAVPLTTFESLIGDARSNAAVGRLTTLGQVALDENHQFGVVELNSDVPGSVRITPVEEWQWAALADSAALPYRLVGPRGRYDVELIAAGTVALRFQIEVRAGETIRMPLTTAVTGPTEIPRPDTGGGFPIIVVILGAAGAIGAAAMLLLGGGGGGGGGGTGTGDAVITINIPPDL